MCRHGKVWAPVPARTECAGGAPSFNNRTEWFHEAIQRYGGGAWESVPQRPHRSTRVQTRPDRDNVSGDVAWAVDLRLASATAAATGSDTTGGDTRLDRPCRQRRHAPDASIVQLGCPRTAIQLT